LGLDWFPVSSSSSSPTTSLILLFSREVKRGADKIPAATNYMDMHTWVDGTNGFLLLLHAL
jgi:hypothetical protein